MELEIENQQFQISLHEKGSVYFYSYQICYKTKFRAEWIIEMYGIGMKYLRSQLI